MFRLTFLGTSAGSPSTKRNMSALAVEIEDHHDWFLVDCGEATQHQLLPKPLSPLRLGTICITHVHGDHTYGLPGLLASVNMSGRKEPLRLIAPVMVWQWLQDTFRYTALDLRYPIEFIDVESLQTTDLPLKVAKNVTLEVWPLVHRVPSYAFKLVCQKTLTQLDTDKLKALGVPASADWKRLQDGQDVLFGDSMLEAKDFLTHEIFCRKIIIAGDNHQPDILTRACQDIDLLVHEATYTQEVADKVEPGPMHSSAKQIASFAENSHVANLILTHFSPRYHRGDAILAIKEEVAQFYHGHCFLAHDGDVFVLRDNGQLVQLDD